MKTISCRKQTYYTKFEEEIKTKQYEELERMLQIPHIGLRKYLLILSELGDRDIENGDVYTLEQVKELLNKE